MNFMILVWGLIFNKVNKIDIVLRNLSFFNNKPDKKLLLL